MPSADNQLNFLTGKGGKDSVHQYTNPFYGVPFKYLPRNVDQMLEWAEHFLFRFGFYKSVLERVAKYFITGLVIECKNKEDEKRYKEAFDTLKWKMHLGEAGVNVLSNGNEYISLQQGFDRFLVCNKCKKETAIDKVTSFTFNRGVYKSSCERCGHKGVFEMIDRPNKAIEAMKIVHWPVKEVSMIHEPTTNDADYFWEIPSEYERLVTKKDNLFFSRKTPKVIFDCLFSKPKKMMKFNSKSFQHVKLPTSASLKTGGRGVPICIYLFDEFFMLKVLERYNEVICFEDINPFRVFAFARTNNPAANPILNTDSGKWMGAIDELIKDHREDPAAYHKFPFPLEMQKLGGDGANFAPVELINLQINRILNALNIPQELYNMNLQAQAVGPALRMFENSWGFMMHLYNDILQHWADVISASTGLTKAKVELMPITMADDMERKSIVSQLVAANSIAKSSLLEMYDLDFEDQLRKKLNEDELAEDIQEEAMRKKEIRRNARADMFNVGGGGKTPGDTMDEATQIAESLIPLEPAQIRQELQKIKAMDETMWSAVKGKMDEMRGQARSQGNAQLKGVQ